MLAFVKHIFSGRTLQKAQKLRLKSQNERTVAAARERRNLLTKLANCEVSHNTQMLGLSRQGRTRVDRLNKDWREKMSSFSTAFRIHS